MNPLVECLGWTLVHFLWQGAAVALLLAMGLRLLRHRPANHRYLASCVALVIMVIAPAVTFHFIEQRLQQAPIPSVEPVSIAPDTTDTAPRPANIGPKVIFAAKPVVPGPSFAQRLEMLLPWLVVGWAIGVLALSCRLLVGWFQINRLRRNAIESLAEPWHAKLAELAQRLGINRPMRLFQSALIEVPTVIGWLRPVILLPASCVVGLTPTQLESILTHELAHIRRHDYLVNLLQSMVETLLFYHPAVWWVSRRIREERENCCDDIAVKTCGDPIEYARALATLEEMRPASAQLAVAASGGPLLQRIQRLLGKSNSSPSSPTWPLAGVIMAIMIMAMATSLRGNRAVAADSLTPETFLTGLGIYHYTNNNSILELTIRSNQLLLAASNSTLNTSAGVNTWAPGRHWFLYVAKGMQVWAYDGNRGLWLLRADPLTGSGSESIGWLRERPPAAVLKRLPKAMIQMLPMPLETRTFHLNPERFAKALEETGFSPRDIKFNDDSKSAGGERVNDGDSKRRLLKLHLVIRQFFTSRGVDFPFDTLLLGQNNLADTNAPTYGKAVYYNERTGLLLVRATSQEMDKLTSILAVINNGKQPHTAVATNAALAAPTVTSFERTNRPHMSKGRKAIISKLDSIRLDSVKYYNLPLTNVINNLSEQVKLHDPDGIGINFFIDRGVPDTNANDATDVGAASVMINPALTNASLGNVLNAIVAGADKPIKFAVLDYAVALSLRKDPVKRAQTKTLSNSNLVITFTEVSFGPTVGSQRVPPEKNTAPPAVSTNSVSSPAATKDESELLIRTYPIDMNALLGSAKKTEGSANAESQSTAERALQAYFTKAGIDLHSINAANTNNTAGYIFNAKSEMLLVHARKADMDKISTLVAKLAPKPQINIKVKFVEIDEAGSHAKGFDWVLKGSLENRAEPAPNLTWSRTASINSIGWPTRMRMTSNSINLQPLGFTNSFDLQFLHVTNSFDLQLSSILTDPQFHVAIETLEQRAGVDELTAPEITTESGRQAELKVGEAQTVVVGPCATNHPQTENIYNGPTLDVFPSVLNDGHSIEVKAIATITEFLGYDVPGKHGHQEVLPMPAKPITVANPVIRLRQLAFDGTVNDGQTIVLGGLGPETMTVMKDKVPVLGDIPLVGRLFRSQSSSKSKKNLLVFITSTLINPDGTAYHSKKELAEAQFSVPQTQPTASSDAAQKPTKH